MHPRMWLLVLLGLVPLVVAGAGTVSFFLLRAGYGVFVGGVVPFVVALLITAALGVLLGRAASGGPGRRNSRPAGPDGVRSRRPDDV